MLVQVLVLLLTAEIGHALQCMTNCSLGEFRFGESFYIPHGQCQERISASECTVRVHLKYHDETYTVELGKKRSSADFIYMNPSPYLSYSIASYCSEGTDCVFSELQKKIDKMTGRNYDVKQISTQLAPLIESSSPSQTIECYNMENKVITCPDDQICGLSYDQQKKQSRARGCVPNSGVRVFVYDATYYSALHVECNRNLCNDGGTLEKIESVLAANGLTNKDGRRIAAGTKEIASFHLFIFSLIFIAVFYF